MLDVLRSFGRWLGETDLSQAVRELLTNVAWLSPTLQTIHILSIAFVIGSTGPIALRLAGVLSDPLDRLANRLIPGIWIALVVMFSTGAVLIINRPNRYFGNWSFLTKMALVALAIALLAGLHAALRRNPNLWAVASPASKALAVLLMAIWVGVIFGGRWIAYI